MLSIKDKITELENRQWTQGIYAKQNWGVWMHSISSYVGRIKPSFAHFLIEIFTSPGDIILDPFCGVGTVPLEADNMNRKSIGNDLNPYAYMISLSKFDRRGIDDEIAYLKKLENISYQPPDISDVPKWVKDFYHKKTLQEILFYRQHLIEDKRYFLLGCLLGIIHGHRPSHLSMRTGYIIPYIPNPKPIAEYREVIPRLLNKAKRMYRDEIPNKVQGKILFNDAKKMDIKTNSIDAVITSPPYYHTLDYVHSNRLRLWFAGIDFDEQEILTDNLIQQRNSYLESMLEVGSEIKRVMKNDALCIFVLGDVHLSNTKTLNTAEDISDLYKDIDFKTHGIVSDKIPPSKTTFVKYGGKGSIEKKKEKLDRILVMSKK